MLTAILLGGMLGLNPLAPESRDSALQAVQELYQYSTSSVEVERDQVQEMLARIESLLEQPQGETASAYQQLEAEARKEQPDGRELRVLARDLYVAIESEQA
jgi:hypothetical protein